MERVIIHKTAEVSEKAKMGRGTCVWNNSQIREGATIGENCVLGKSVYIDKNVKIGNNVKIQNTVSIYRGVTVSDCVLIGPHTCLINDKIPRATNPNEKLKTDSDWNVRETFIDKGASIGAGSIILPGIKIGKYAMIGAGSVITKNVPDHGLVYGNPAKLFGYVCFCGKPFDSRPPTDFLCNDCKKI